MENTEESFKIEEIIEDDEFELPDEFDAATWPKGSPTPKAMVHDAESQLKLKVKFETLCEKRDGPFGCRLVVTWLDMHFFSEYIVPSTHNTKKIAFHNASLKFLKNPPEWLTKTLTDANYRMNVASDVARKATQAKQQIWSVGDEEQESKFILVEEEATDITFEDLKQDMADNPTSFIDVFGDDRLKVKILSEGSEYPETGAKVAIHYVCRKESDGSAFEDSFTDKVPIAIQLYNDDGHLLCLDFGVSMLKIGGEALIVTDALYAYGENGLPGKVGPNETILIYVKLLSSKKGNSKKEDIDEISKMALSDRLANVNEYKSIGNRFFYVFNYKLALDQYMLALRFLPAKKKTDKIGSESSEGSRNDLLLLARATLHGNLAACFMKLEDWEQTLNHADVSLEITDDVKVRMRKCRALIALDRLDEADYELHAIKLIKRFDDTNDEKLESGDAEVPVIKSSDVEKLSGLLLKAKIAYEKKLKLIQKKMAEGLFEKQ